MMTRSSLNSTQQMSSSAPWLALAFAALLGACGTPDAGPDGAAVDSQEASRLERVASHSIEAPRDVILVTLDTLRYDALDFLAAADPSGDERFATPVPHLEKLAEQGRSFTFALAHNTITLPSHANILTGHYPFEHGVRENAAYKLPDEMPSLAERLAAEGFATGAFVSAYVLDARFGLADGFETYDDRMVRDSKPSALQVWERTAPGTLDAALDRWRSQAERRRFLWLHLFEPHLPYAPPEPFAGAHQDQPYRGEVAALDHFLGDLFELARDEEQRPLIVVTADHGESLGDHGEPAHGIFAYQSTIHVPLILWGPGLEAGADNRLARHIDIVPTVLDALRLSSPEALPGRSLLGPASDDTTSYFEALSATFDSGWAPLRGLVEARDRLKVIDLPIPELYDLEADPDEENNLVSERRRDFHRLRSLLPEESSWPPPRGELSDEAAARLRSLGYLSDDSGTIKASFAPADDPKRWIHVEQLKQRYAAQMRDGLADEAILTARQVLEQQPQMSLAHTMLADAQLLGGDRRAALETMGRAWQQGAASPELSRRLTSSLLRDGQARVALEVISRIAGDDTDSKSLYGQALRENGQPDAALKVLREVLAEAPADAPTLERLSAVALDLGNPQQAADYAKRALDLDEELAQAWNNLGVAKVMTGETDGALDAWQRALALDPELWDTLYNLGFQAAAAGRLELAKDALRRFVEGAPPARYGQDLPKARRLLQQLNAAGPG